jgi:ABC-type branched-subunit amino acid transport system ATPase component
MTTQMLAESLGLRDIGVSFGATVALESVTLDLPPTGVIALIGRNGSGKSSLLDVLAGFIRQSRGSVIRASDGGKLNLRYLISHVARLHQRLVLPSNISAADLLQIVACKRSLRSLMAPASLIKISTAPDDKLSGLMRAAGLAEKMTIPLGELSYGQQRVAALTAVFATGKAIIALDEPLAGLGPAVRDWVLKLIKEKSSSRCVLIAEHDIAGALAVADRLIILQSGKVVCDLDAPVLSIDDVITKL